MHKQKFVSSALRVRQARLKSQTPVKLSRPTEPRLYGKRGFRGAEPHTQSSSIFSIERKKKKKKKKNKQKKETPQKKKMKKFFFFFWGLVVFFFFFSPKKIIFS